MMKNFTLLAILNFVSVIALTSCVAIAEEVRSGSDQIPELPAYPLERFKSLQESDEPPPPKSDNGILHLSRFFSIWNPEISEDEYFSDLNDLYSCIIISLLNRDMSDRLSDEEKHTEAIFITGYLASGHLYTKENGETYLDYSSLKESMDSFCEEVGEIEENAPDFPEG